MSNARIQFSLATEEDWLAYDPQLKEGEIVTVVKVNKKVKLVQGKIGGSKYSESTVIWDEDAAQSLTNTSAAAALAAENHATAAAASQSAAKASETKAKTSETAAAASQSAAKASETKAKTSETAAANSATESAAAAAIASNQAGLAQNSASAAGVSAQEAAAHKNISVDRATAADQSATAALDYKNQAVESANTASTAANTASEKATTAISEATKAKNEADRAEGFANSIDPTNLVTKSEFVPFQGATPAANGAAGLVPAPSKAEVGKVLGASGQWIAQYSHPASGVAVGTYRSVTVDNQGHVTGGSNPTLPISAGGTGATTAEAARTNLGIGNNMLVPVGTVLACAATSVPNGYLLCNGAAVSRTTYAALFSAVGTTYGAGNGSSTFNLPNLIDRFVQGSNTAGTSIAAGLANHYHAFGYNNSDNAGRFLATNETGSYSAVSGHRTWNGSGGGGSFKAANTDTPNNNMITSYAVFNGGVTVQPPALTLRYIIKY